VDKGAGGFGEQLGGGADGLSSRAGLGLSAN
jgi:hypothetical protein